MVHKENIPVDHKMRIQLPARWRRRGSRNRHAATGGRDDALEPAIQHDIRKIVVR